MAPHESSSRHSLAECGTSEVQATNFEHCGARGAKYGRADAEAQHQRREDYLLKVEPRIGEHAREWFRRRKIMKVRRHENDEHGSQNEHRNRETDHGDCLSDVILPATRVKSTPH